MYEFFSNELCFKDEWHKLDKMGFVTIYVDMCELFWLSTVILTKDNEIVTLQCDYTCE